MELWRHSNDTGWTLCATFPNRNTGSGGLTVEGKQVAYESDIPTKLSEFTKDIDFDERYYTETEINTLLADKVDNSRVLTNVPANAKFTDTTYDVATTSTSGLMSSTDKTNLDNNTAARHTHSNKSVIDKFTEVDNKLFYNGEEIGSGDPGESSWVNLGRFNNKLQVIGYIVMNQLTSGNYVFEIPFGENPSYGFAKCIALVSLNESYTPHRLQGTLYSADGLIYNFALNPYTGQLNYVGMLNLDALMTDITDQFS